LSREAGLFRVDFGLVDQHDGNVVFDRIDAAALRAFEPGLVGGRGYGDLADRADEDFQQDL